MEILDVVDSNGVPTGETVERTAAHAEGIRHRTAHVWLVRKRGHVTEVLLQKRAPDKDSFPNCWDISSAGHIPAGMDWIPSALRELREELGITVEADRLIFLDLLRFNTDTVMYGRPFRDNQVTKVYVLWEDRDEDGFTPQPEEVSEVRWFDFKQLLADVASGAMGDCLILEELRLVYAGVAETGC